MFRFIITIVYILPLVYVFVRMWKLLIPKGYKISYTLIFIVMASLYPVFNLFLDIKSESIFYFSVRILELIAPYFLVFFLYIFLIILLFDIFLLLNKFFHIVSRPVLKNSRIKTKAFILIVLLSVSIVIAGSIHFNTIRTSHYQIEIPKRSSQMNDLRIAFAADFHLQENTSIHFVERFVEKINAIQPDLMLFGGDIVEGDGNTDKQAQFEKLIREIKSTYGTFGVIGNHEIYGGKKTEQFFKEAGIRLLKDTIEVVNNSVNLIGRYDQHKNDRLSLKELLEQSRDTLPVIMLDHRPTEISQVSDTRVDMQLSGHTHNGQLFPFNLITKSIYPLSWGYEEINDTHFFVTSGIRLWGPRVRTTGVSEIMVIDVRFK